MAQMVHAALLALCSIGLIVIATAQALPPPPDCGGEILKMVTCLQFVTGKAPAPLDSCCEGLKTVQAEKPVCLCELIQPGGQNGLPEVNNTLAMEMPALCHVDADPSKCPALLGLTPPPSANSTIPASGSAPVPSPTAGGPTMATPAAAFKSLPSTLVFLTMAAGLVSALF